MKKHRILIGRLFVERKRLKNIQKIYDGIHLGKYIEVTEAINELEQILKRLLNEQKEQIQWEHST